MPKDKDKDNVGDLRGRAALQRRATDPEEIGALAPEVAGSTTHDASAWRKTTVADIGSGAGFPGIPIKLWAPTVSLTLIESNHKKATFLREVARALTLMDIDIETVRAESLSGGTFDLVTLRAVERFETVLAVAAGLVAPGGRLALLIGSSQFNKARINFSAGLLAEFIWSDPLPTPASRSRILAVAHRRTRAAVAVDEPTC